MNMQERNRIFRDFVEHLKSDFDISLGARMEELAQSRPGQVAITSREEEVTYGQLNQRANQYAGYFSSAGYQRGEAVALLMENSVDAFAVVIGLNKLGITAALINMNLKKSSLAHDINLCDASALLVDAGYIGQVEEVKDYLRMKVPGEILVRGMQNSEIPEGMEAIEDKLSRTLETGNPPSTESIKSFEIAAYVFTSGSDGYRKNVPVTHQRWLLSGKALQLFTGMKEDSIQYMCLPFHLNSGFSACFASMAAAGCTLALEKEFSATSFWKDVSRFNADHFFGVGEMLRYIYLQEPSEMDKAHGLITIISNGISEELVEPFKERFGVKHIIETYATTENVGIFMNLEEIPGMCGNLNLAGIRQGEVVAYDSINDKIITDSYGKAVKCAPGEVGLLLCEINESNNFEGYINDTGQGESLILQDVFNPGDRYLNSCDLLQLHQEDYLSFEQKLGPVFRWKGMSVSTYKVADVIKKFFGAIDDAFVFGEKVPGYEGSCGMAVITLLEGEQLDWKKFNNYIKRRLPVYKRPVFIRVTGAKPLEEELKQRYREEGADPRVIAENSSDEIYVYDLSREEYIPLTGELYSDIVDHRFKV